MTAPRDPRRLGRSEERVPVLEIRSLLKSYDAPDGERQTVIDVPQFDVSEAELVALRGASGSGKTTFLHLVAGILTADAGSLRIAGEDMAALSEAGRDRLRAASVGYVFQTFNLLQGYTALENVELGMAFGRGVDAVYAKHLLERVGLADRMRHPPRQLSVGQQQRVALARALANRPALVLADEPTGNLDASRAREAVDLLLDVCRESAAALVLVSHDAAVLSRFTRVDDLALLNRAQSGSAEGSRP
jgi:ABC-type lipoprotein export system ATPase subunit